jgi:hypothetical protein
MKARVNLTLDAALWERFRIRAIQEKTSGSATIDRLMGEYLERPGPSHPQRSGRKTAYQRKDTRRPAASVRSHGPRPRKASLSK